MKRTITILLILSAMTMTTSIAANDNFRVGDRIGCFYGGETEFPADAPFYISHGFMNSATYGMLGLYGFSVDVDGVALKHDFLDVSPVKGQPGVSRWFWIYNFPDGMTGTHTFTCHWYAPCGDVCEHSNQILETTRTLIVTFSP